MIFVDRFTLYVQSSDFSTNGAELSFTTPAVSPARVFIREQGSDDVQIASIQRIASLYLELRGAVVAALDATSKSVGEMWVVDRSNKTRSLICNDADVAKLQTDSLIEATLVDCTHSQRSFGETTEGSYPSKQYIHDHWVSASAGYYAVTGKMTTEEENALLLMH